ncbi:cholinesterase precursor [Niveomyces insectorum RCEF 264]|uniref:Carboxylic ester hydrolase n=1 Tax=Niveomyces insectorum RCEF 264 TaxID=1081102 RepID=A0A167QZ56_9HYPO|nr:cholinesterase precursor [Niveomyces insectorum RCEF 264]
MVFSDVFRALALYAGVTLAAATSSNGCGSAAAKYLTVDSSNGPITGHFASNTQCVIEYLGIPYAKPPVGSLRFAAPERFTANEPYEAAAFGSDCPLTASKPVDYPGFTPQAQRIVNFFASAAGTPQSEDCLTLNIWSKPSGNACRPNKPVYVFFYGGRFTIGNTDSPFYNGKYFAEAEDIVVVTVNYRLNLFGFPGYPEGTQNLGLRDQRAAVEWVRDNIAKFGGDPARITIGGQSSGGVSVDYWAYAYQEDPIAHGIIAHSGNVFSFPVNDKTVQEANWAKVVAAVNCSDAADEMACMRTVDWQTLEAVSAGLAVSPSSSVLRPKPAFWPKVDDEVVFADYLDRTARGSFAKLPLLLGNNNNENGYYQIPAFAKGIVPTPDQVRSFLLESFTCPVAYQAAARQSHGVPAYAYRYFADWDNTRLYPTSGAYHGVDLHMIFGASADVSGLPTSAPQRQLTRVMQTAWHAFCADPHHGLARLGWPHFDPNGDTLVQLGLDNVPKAQFTRPSVYDAPCSTITMGAFGTAPATS